MDFDTAWSRAVSFFMGNNIPVSTIDRASGLISANDVTVFEGGSYFTPQDYLNCPASSVSFFYRKTTANISVILQPQSPDTTGFNLNVAGRGFLQTR